MHGKRLHAAQAGRPSSQTQVADEGIGGRETTGQLERQYAAEAAHLLCGQLVLWMAQQPGVMHPGHGGMALQRFGERLAVLVVPGHPQWQGA